MTSPAPSRETLTKLCRAKEKISLIKEYRYFKDSSLKDAKDAIETAQSGSFSDHSVYFDEGKILALFGYGPEEANKLMAALELLNRDENWRVLGFSTFKDSVKVILGNF